MINTKKCRADFLALLNNLVNESSCKEIGAQIFSLKKYLKEEYYYGKDLPEISIELVDNISEDLDYIANLYNRFILSKEFGLEDDIRKDRYNLINTASGFVKKYRLNSSLVNINYHLTDLLSVQDYICDCLNDMLTEIDNLIGDANVLQSEICSGINSFNDVITTKKCSPVVMAAIESCIDALLQVLGTLVDFIRNYNDMKAADTIDGDKYFHSKANCDAAKRGKLASFVAKGICDLREYTDTYKNILIKGMTLAESLQDSKEDQDANIYGREQGTKYPEVESRILIDKYRPNGLPNKY